MDKAEVAVVDQEVSPTLTQQCSDNDNPWGCDNNNNGRR